MCFDAERVCGVDENTSMLRSDDGLDDRGEVVDIGERFHTEEDVVERPIFQVRCMLGRLDN